MSSNDQAEWEITAETPDFWQRHIGVAGPDRSRQVAAPLGRVERDPRVACNRHVASHVAAAGHRLARHAAGAENENERMQAHAGT